MFKSKNTVYCFSPPVMIATCIIELGLAVYTLTRYKMTPIIRTATAMLFLLALFQLSEYGVCGWGGIAEPVWSRVGYVAITLLPPLALHLIHMISKHKAGLLVVAAYATGISFAAVFGLQASAFAGHVCAGNYAIFQIISPLGGLYFVYYYAWLLIGISLSLYWSMQARQPVRQALVMQVFGYLSFLLPTGIVNAINPQSISGIPSVMCGFAVIYAIILALYIVPHVQRHALKSH